MIGLNREKPKNCLDCPCFATYDFKDEQDKEHMIRWCQATNKMLFHTERKNYDENEKVREQWMNFKIPIFCPWICIDNYNRDSAEEDDEFR